ncbi:MAG: (4Fe-4S)-binding protein, partial [Bdellovibrionota bacterium]
MQKPPTPQGKVWVTEHAAALYMDTANAIYVSMLRVLVQSYAIEGRPSDARQALLNTAFTLMHALVPVAERLTYLPANPEFPHVKAGMSFAVPRNLDPFAISTEKQMLTERLKELNAGLDRICDYSNQNNFPEFFNEDIEKTRASLKKASDFLDKVYCPIEDLEKAAVQDPDKLNIASKQTISNSDDASENKQQAQMRGAPDSPKQTAFEAAPREYQYGRGNEIDIQFEAKRCIHARHCVTGLPQVFQANKPGEWIFPDLATKEQIISVCQACPSGALQYRRADQVKEPVPNVNIVKTRENGALAFLGQLNINGNTDSFRATLCRCGLSNNKPYCDGSHVAGKFKAAGERENIDETLLSERNGLLKIETIPDGPLHIAGNLE